MLDELRTLDVGTTGRGEIEEAMLSMSGHILQSGEPKISAAVCERLFGDLKHPDLRFCTNSWHYLHFAGIQVSLNRGEDCIEMLEGLRKNHRAQ